MSTPVKVYLNICSPIQFPESVKVFGTVSSLTLFGDYETIRPILDAHQEHIEDLVIETPAYYIKGR